MRGRSHDCSLFPPSGEHAGNACKFSARKHAAEGDRSQGCVHIHVAVASWADAATNGNDDDGNGNDENGGSGRNEGDGNGGGSASVAYRFSVEDNGPGIPRAAQTKIFRTYQQAGLQPGTGPSRC